MTALPTLPALARPASPKGVTLVPVKETLWRVTDKAGTVLGHIERRTDADGERFAARRLIAAVRSMELGVFWRIDDAADCFR
ncbi:hypothetical protein [Glaciibacter superstes]|uniref:hypothetical protein n=1 Tax=Glaciibacter superstes TaxID=501023 RepID=UPI0003B3E95C|nr:hypothetical protein [Glaciibacter superstes]